MERKLFEEHTLVVLQKKNNSQNRRISWAMRFGKSDDRWKSGNFSPRGKKKTWTLTSSDTS